VSADAAHIAYEVIATGSLFDAPDAPPIDGVRKSGNTWIASLTYAELLDVIERHGRVTIEKPKRGDFAWRLLI
jgi:hypothetical protein